MLGQIIDNRYQLTRELGKGGMGVVYEAINLRNGTSVAVKILATNILSEMPSVMARFEREVRASSSINCDNIVRVLDAGTDEAIGAPYMVMELILGQDLHHWFRQLRLMRPDTIIRVAGQIGTGLAKAHEAGVIHRDIKPGNVFIAEHGEVMTAKVLDFGIAKLKMEQVQGDAGLTKTGNMLGSPHYMSPEQAQGLKTIDQRTDVWSLGILMYKALTGRTPYADLDSMGQVIIAIFAKPIPPVQDTAPWVSPELAAIVHKALEKNPNERYGTVEEMNEALRKLSSDGTFHLTKSMFTTLTTQERTTMAPRLDAVTRLDALIKGEMSQSSGSLTAGAIELPVIRPATTETTVVGVPPSAPRSRWSTAAVIGAVAIGVVGVVSVTRIVVRQQPVAAATVAPLPSAAPLVIPTAPSASAAAEPPASAAPIAPAAPAEVKAKFKVPAKAVVLIDGVAATATGDEIELVGPPGAHRTVLVRVGAKEGAQVVTLTEKGADPAEMPAEVLKVKKAAAGGNAPAAKKPGETAPPAPTAKGIDRTFDP